MHAIPLQQPALGWFERLECGCPIYLWIGRKGWLCFLDLHNDCAMSIAKGIWSRVFMSTRAILVVLWSDRNLQSIHDQYMWVLELAYSMLCLLVSQFMAFDHVWYFPTSWDQRALLLVTYPLLYCSPLMCSTIYVLDYTLKYSTCTLNFRTVIL